MKNKLTKNWGLKLVSILFAILLWIVVTNINDPVVSVRFSDIPVNIENDDLITDKGQVYEVLDNTDVIDTVTIYAPRSIIDSLDKSNVVAVADMNDLTSLDTIGIKLTTNKYSDKLESIRGNIDNVKLSIEEKQSKALLVRASVVGEVREGYMVGSVSTEQNLVRISGPESVVSRVAKAQAEVDVTGFASSIDTDTDIRLYDEEGNEVSSGILERSINKVRINVAILEKKTVPITYTVSGTPAEGYRLTEETRSTRSSVTIAGRSSQLQRIDAVEIPEGVIDVSGATEDVTQTVDLNDYLPENIILAEDDFTGIINITACVGQELHRTLNTPVDEIRVTGVPEGFEAEITEPEDRCTVTLIGLAEELQALDLNTLEVSVDVAAWLEQSDEEELTAGYHRVPVTVSLPEDSPVVWEETTVQLHVTETE